MADLNTADKFIVDFCDDFRLAMTAVPANGEDDPGVEFAGFDGGVLHLSAVQDVTVWLTDWLRRHGELPVQMLSREEVALRLAVTLAGRTMPGITPEAAGERIGRDALMMAAGFLRVLREQREGTSDAT